MCKTGNLTPGKPWKTLGKFTCFDELNLEYFELDRDQSVYYKAFCIYYENGDFLDLYPAMIDGPILGAFHGVIQLGYGLAAQCDSMSLEGLAYTFHQYFPFFRDDMQNPKVPAICDIFYRVHNKKVSFLELILSGSMKKLKLKFFASLRGNANLNFDVSLY